MAEKETMAGLFPETQPEDAAEMAEREVGLIPMTDDFVALDKSIERVDKQVEAFKKIRQICLKLTNVHDWSFQGDNLYMDETGASKIGIAWGMDVTPEKIEKELITDDAGPYYAVTTYGRGYSRVLGRMVKDIGVATSREPFFAKLTVRDERGVRSELIPMEKVDIGDVKKKSVTNFYGRIIKRCLGLGNVTPAELEAAGIAVKDIARVEFKKDRKTAEANLTPKAAAQRGEIEGILEFLSAGTPEAKAGFLREATVFKGRDGDKFVTEIRDLVSEGWIGTTLGKLKAKLQKEYPEEYTRRYPAGQNGAAQAGKEEKLKPTAGNPVGPKGGSRG
jgi:hypothetical protein